MITKSFSKSVVQYDPETGQYTWIYCHRKPWMNGRTATHETSRGKTVYYQTLEEAIAGYAKLGAEA